MYSLVLQLVWGSIWLQAAGSEQQPHLGTKDKDHAAPAGSLAS